MTRSAAAAAGGLSYLVTERTWHDLHQLNLYNGADLPDMAQKLDFAHLRGVRLCQYQHAITNTFGGGEEIENTSEHF